MEKLGNTGDHDRAAQAAAIVDDLLANLQRAPKRQNSRGAIDKLAAELGTDPITVITIIDSSRQAEANYRQQGENSGAKSTNTPSPKQ